MKILFVCENYLPNLGGAEVLFKNLAERYVKKGHQVTVLTHHISGTKKKETINGVKIARVSSFGSRYIFTFSSILAAIYLARKNDIIQTTSFNGAPPAWLAAKLTKKPVVITVHEVWNGKWQEITGFSWIKSKIHEILEAALYFLSYDNYICVSNATKLDLLKLSIPNPKITVIYNGLDYDFWDKTKVAKSNLRQEFGLGKKFVFFSWGRPGPTKGFEYLIKAFKDISEKFPQAVLLLMLGKIKTYEPMRLKLLNLIDKLNLQAKVRVINPVSDEKLREFLIMVNCAIIPSTSEGFGYTTVEASTLGTPVIVSNAGSIPEVVFGKHLIFENKNHIDLADKAVKAIQNQFFLSENKIFPWDTTVEKYLSIYQSFMKRNT